MKSIITSLVFIFSLNSLSAQFSTEQLIEPSNPESLASSDLDGDGDIDILTTSRQSNKIIWFENIDSEGNFESPKVIDHTFKDPHLINSADVNGDGNKDIIVASKINEKIVWYENLNGQAEFSSLKLIASNLPNLISQTLSDIDNDADQDILIIYNNKIAWLENLDNNGNFGNPTILVENISGKAHACITDLDNDGNKDLIFGSDEEENLEWISNINSPSSSQLIATNPSGFNSSFAADFDGDNDLDIVASVGGDHVFIWYKNTDGTGTFESPTFMDDNFFDEGFQVTSFDVDMDSDMDIIIQLSSQNSESIRWFENTDGQGDFEKNDYGSLSNEGRHKFVIDDLNGDNFLDFAAIDDEVNNYNIMWAKNSGSSASTNHFDENKFIHSHWPANHGYAVDFDNDGDQDLVGFGGGASWYENLNGNGLFSTKKNINVSSFWSPKGYIGDINGDNFIDIIIIDEDEDEVAWYPHLDGQGNFGDKIILGTNSEYTEVGAVGDVDNDGDLDIVAGGWPRLVWFENINGQGLFTPAKSISTLSGAVFHQIEIADINGDGNQDLTIGATNKIGWYENLDGQGNFSSLNGMPSSIFGADYIYVTDIDGDNDNDVIYPVTNFATSNETLRWYENTDGLGNFDTGGILDDDINVVRSIVSTDVDLDGDRDIISSDYWTNEINMYENLDGLGTFGQKSTISDQFHEILKVGTDDFNGDNVDDLFAFSAGNNKIAWFQNLASSPRIQVFTFWDKNENMTKEADEIGLNHQNITIMPDGLNTFSLDQGLMEFPVNSGNYDINCSPSNGWTLTTSADLNIDVQANQSTIQYFGLKPQGELIEAEVSLTSSPTRCGFTVPFWLTYTNTSNQVFDAEITLELDDLVTLVGIDFPPSQTIGNQLLWNIENLNPTESGQIKLELIMPGVDYLGEYLNFSSNISLINDSGITIFNDEHEYEPQINCAYDPNDKLVSPVLVYEGDNYTLFDQTLEYTIRFQNTGTDTAFNIQITDQLDPNLDWSTFTPQNSSHPFSVSLNETGLVDFRFENILLPDSSTNLIESQGFVKYKIKSKDGILENTIIENTASIFFDFNPPIITNTTENIMVSEYPFEIEPGNQNTGSDLAFSFQPNPSNGTVNIDFEFEEKQVWEIQLHNSWGKLIRSYEGETTGLKNKALFFQGLANGVYYLTLFSNDTSKTEKLIIID